jgi:biotin carboxylase
MTPKKLMIITAGYWQIPVILKAKELGYYVIATDSNPNAEGVEYADEFYNINSLDTDSLINIAVLRNISGVIAEQTDIAVKTAAEIAQALGLRGIGTEVAFKATNKSEMRDICSKAGIPIPKYGCVSSIDDAILIANEIGFPVIIKPTDSQSSKGVAKVNDIFELKKCFDEAMSHSYEGRVLIEELLIGIESSVEAYVKNGVSKVLGISEKTKSMPPYSFDLRLIYPARFSNKLLKELIDLNQLVTNAINIPFGISHAEFIITKKGIYLLEIAARGCGSGVASILIPALTGFDPIAARILDAFGIEYSPVLSNSSNFAILEFLIFDEGKISAIYGLDEALKIPGVLSVDLFIKTGQSLSNVKNGAERHGYCIVIGETFAIVEERIKTVKKYIHVKFES